MRSNGNVVRQASFSIAAREENLVAARNKHSDPRASAVDQVGEDLVTNPEAQSIPEELLMDPEDPAGDQIVRYSNRTKPQMQILSTTRPEETY